MQYAYTPAYVEELRSGSFYNPIKLIKIKRQMSPMEFSNFFESLTYIGNPQEINDGRNVYRDNNENYYFTNICDNMMTDDDDEN